MRKLLLGALAVPLALGVGSQAVLGHGGASEGVQGTVTSLNSTTLQVQTQTGSVSIALASNTHVERMVSGSTADLRPGQHVDAHLVPGTTSIDAITIEAAAQPQPARPAGSTHTGARPQRTPTGTSPRPHPQKTPQPRTHVEGQVVSLSGSTLVLRDFHGKSSSYSLNGSPAITKIMNGTVADLAIGENVRVLRARNGAAALITILNA